MIKKTKKYLVLSGSIAVVILSLQINSFCQSSDKILTQRIHLNLPETTMLYVLNKLAYQYQVPIGLERASDYRQKLKEKMYFENGEVRWKKDTLAIVPGTLEEVLNSLIKQEPEYKWELQNGVINFLPVKSRDKFLENLLGTKVGIFSPQKGLSKFEVRDSIIELSEVKKILESENVFLLKRDYPNSNYLYDDKEISISITNASVKDVLNKIVKNNPFKIWVIERIGDDKESLIVTF